MNNTRRRKIYKEVEMMRSIALMAEGYDEKYNGRVITEEEMEVIKEAFEEAGEILSDAIDTIDDLEIEEPESLENLPETIQGSERGEAMELAADNLESGRYSIEEAQSNVESLQRELDDYDFETDLNVDFTCISDSIEEAIEILEEAVE